MRRSRRRRWRPPRRGRSSGAAGLGSRPRRPLALQPPARAVRKAGGWARRDGGCLSSAAPGMPSGTGGSGSGTALAPTQPSPGCSPAAAPSPAPQGPGLGAPNQDKKLLTRETRGGKIKKGKRGKKAQQEPDPGEMSPAQDSPRCCTAECAFGVSPPA